MIYLDNAATTFPKPDVVVDAMVECLKTYGANPGRSGHQMALRMDREIFAARNEIAQFLNVDNPLHVIFTLNCTDSLNIAINGLVQEGDHVITTSLEHNSVLRPLHELQKKDIIELTVISADETGTIDYDRFEDAIQENTALCVATHISNLTGTILDTTKIGKIMKKHDVIYIVDAAQSMGYMMPDMEYADVVCFPGHKGLFGPMGTGVLYFKEGIEIQAFRDGGTGSFSEQLTQPEVYPDRLESGTANGPGIVGLREGVKFVRSIGLENIKAHEDQLKNAFIEGLQKIDGVIVYGPKDERQAPVVTINIQGLDSSIFAHLLDEKFQIATRGGLHCAPLAHASLQTVEKGAVRFSFGYFNTMDDVEYALKAVQQIAEEK